MVWYIFDIFFGIFFGILLVYVWYMFGIVFAILFGICFGICWIYLWYIWIDFWYFLVWAPVSILQVGPLPLSVLQEIGPAHIPFVKWINQTPKGVCPDTRYELSHYVSCPHVWNVARTAFPYLRFQTLHDRLCVDKPCTESLKVLAATFTAYHTIKPTLGNAPLSFDTARCQFQCSFYTAVRAAGLFPDTPAD